MDDIYFQPYRSEYEPMLCALDSACEKVRIRKSWIGRYQFAPVDPLGVRLAFNEKQLIGSAMCQINTYLINKKSYIMGYLADVAVHPQFQRRGLGRKLSDKALEFAESKKAQGMFLFTSPDNSSAYNLYVNMGFSVFAENELLVLTGPVIGSIDEDEEIRGLNIHDCDEQKAMISTMYNDYSLYTENSVFINCPTGEDIKPGVNTFVLVKKNTIVASLNVVNYEATWDYYTPNGEITPPLLLCNYASKDKTMQYLREILTALSIHLFNKSTMIAIMVDVKEKEKLLILKDLGFVAFLKGVWMGKSFHKEFNLDIFNKPIFTGFPT